jgi:mRNA-degrading endonuclease RelE of RelBE toxin-antitoxin system
MGKPHKWHLTWDKCVVKEIAKAGDYAEHIFRAIEELARADNPLSISDVRRVEYDFPGCHRRRVGKWRIIFEMITGQEVEVDLCGNQKGEIHIYRVSLRKESYTRR